MRREFSAGGIVYKKVGNRVVWLIRRPTPNHGYRGNLGWSFPKGLIENNERAEPAAVREVIEEGGVQAKIVTKLPTLKVFFTNQVGEKVMKFITYFVMEYESDSSQGHGWETEETRWVTLDEAQKLLTYKNEKELLTQAEGMITSDHGPA